MNTFLYHISAQDKYILVELSGTLNENGIKQATSELLSVSARHNIKRVLYDTSRLKQSDEVRQLSVYYFRLVSQQMEKLASYLPNIRIFALAKFLSLVADTNNWKPFRSKEKAISWLCAD